MSPRHSGCWWALLWYPVPTVRRLCRDCFRQGTENSAVETPSSPYQEERDDHVMSPGPTARSRCLEAGAQNRPGEAVSSPLLGLLFLKGQWHSPVETANRNQNLGLKRRHLLFILGIQARIQAQESSGEIPKQDGPGKRTYGTHLPSSTLGSCALLNPQRGSWGVGYFLLTTIVLYPYPIHGPSSSVSWSPL